MVTDWRVSKNITFLKPIRWERLQISQVNRIPKKNEPPQRQMGRKSTLTFGKAQEKGGHHPTGQEESESVNEFVKAKCGLSV